MSKESPSKYNANAQLYEREAKDRYGAALANVFDKERPKWWSPWQNTLADLIESTSWDLILGVIIVANSAVVILDTNLNAQGGGIPDWLIGFRIFFTVVYTVELVVRLAVYRLMFFENSWNIFDFVVVSTDILSEVLAYFLADLLPSVGVLRVFRIFRLVRFVETLAMFKELNMMVRLMISSFRSMFWGTFLTLIFLTIWSIVAVEFIHPLNKDLAEKGYYENCERCGRAFENVYQSNLTFFRQLIFGDSWGQPSEVLIENYPWTAFILIPAGITIQIGLLNLILTVIVDKATEEHQKDERRRLKEQELMYAKTKAKLVQFCEELDEDRSGELSMEEIVAGFDNNPEFAKALSLMDIGKDDIGVVFSILDEDGSGGVTFTEFVDQLYKMKSQDVQTLLLFIKGYIHEMRAKMNEHLKITKTDIQVKINQLVEGGTSNGIDNKLISDHTFDKDQSAVSLGFDALSMQLKRLTDETNYLRSATCKIEDHLRQYALSNAQQLQELSSVLRHEGAADMGSRGGILRSYCTPTVPRQTPSTAG